MMFMQCWTSGDLYFLNYSSYFTKIFCSKKLIGYFLHWGLFGALSVQVCEQADCVLSGGIRLNDYHCSDIYYLAFSNDPPKRKILVYSIYAVELVQTILFTKVAFEQLAAGFGNFDALNHGGLLWFAVPILSSTGTFSSIFLGVLCLQVNYIVEFVVQLFYAYRIKVLAGSNLVPIVVVLVNTSFFVEHPNPYPE